MTRRWVADPWSDDDPAIRRMRDVLRGPEAVQDAPGRPEPAAVESEPTPEPVRPSEESTARRGRIADLVARVQAGDLSAVDILRRLIDGT